MRNRHIQSQPISDEDYYEQILRQTQDENVEDEVPEQARETREAEQNGQVLDIDFSTYSESKELEEGFTSNAVLDDSGLGAETCDSHETGNVDEDRRRKIAETLKQIDSWDIPAPPRNAPLLWWRNSPLYRIGRATVSVLRFILEHPELV